MTSGARAGTRIVGSLRSTPPYEDLAGNPLWQAERAALKQGAASGEIPARTALTAGPSGEAPSRLAMADDTHTTRGIILRMIEETARHAGHLDLARELVDGRTGLGPR